MHSHLLMSSNSLLQEQVDSMLREDTETLLITASDEVVSEIKKGLVKLFSAFENEVSLLRLESIMPPCIAEKKILECLSDLEWMWNVLQKMDLMREFIFLWAQISNNILKVVLDEQTGLDLWELKLKLIEVTSKILEAVGYGNVAIPTPCRVQLLNSWLPYIRKVKPLLDSEADARNDFAYKMDEDLCQNIEGAITSLLLALPSDNQGDILADWMMSTEQLSYPDLSEAFEIWCYRTKSANRRLLEGG
uniref:BTB/POZ domain-containing protein n=1 Tax=Sedum alfredii TaxID=439688 RepID=A0A8E4XYT5_9MAGN|nr:BTB/POZ domain-containing protein [Sedum alfredii]